LQRSTVLSLFKWQNASFKYGSLLVHISFKRNSAKSLWQKFQIIVSENFLSDT